MKEIDKLAELSPEDKQTALKELKTTIETQFKNIDDEKVSGLINKVSDNMNTILGEDSNLA